MPRVELEEVTSPASAQSVAMSAVFLQFNTVAVGCFPNWVAIGRVLLRKPGNPDSPWSETMSETQEMRQNFVLVNENEETF